MPLSRRELKELEKIITAITTDNLRAMVVRDHAKHSREVLAAAERELTKRGVEFAASPQGVEADQCAGDPPEATEGEGRRGGIFGGAVLSD